MCKKYVLYELVIKNNQFPERNNSKQNVLLPEKTWDAKYTEQYNISQTNIVPVFCSISLDFAYTKLICVQRKAKCTVDANEEYILRAQEY